MKNLLIFLALIGAGTNAHSQALELGLHGGYGTTWLLNNNVSDQGPELDPKATFAPLVGLRAGYFFKSKVALFVEVNSSTVRQDYTGTSTLGTMEARNKLQYIQVPVLFHISGKSFFFEVGPQFSFLSSAKQDYKTSPATLDYTGLDIKTGFNSTLISAAFGIGGHFRLTDALYLNAALRFNYGFSDVTKEFSQAELALQQGKIGTATGYAHTDQKGNYSYKATQAATGHVLIGIAYRINMGSGDK